MEVNAKPNEQGKVILFCVCVRVCLLRLQKHFVGSKVPWFFTRTDHLHNEMKWQNRLGQIESLSLMAYISTCKDIAFYMSVFINLIIMFTFPLDQSWHPVTTAVHGTLFLAGIFQILVAFVILASYCSSFFFLIFKKKY